MRMQRQIHVVSAIVCPEHDQIRDTTHTKNNEFAHTATFFCGAHNSQTKNYENISFLSLATKRSMYLESRRALNGMLNKFVAEIE